jgi:hypothetical protein
MKHSLANYPSQFLGCVISPTKICLQFEEVTAKLRFKEGASYVKLPSTHKALPISVSGTAVDILAVGCQMPVIEDLQAALLSAYVVYGLQHLAAYEAAYNKEFIEFLMHTRKGLDDAIQKLTK